MTRPQGTCPVCGKRTGLYRDGTLHDHGSRASHDCAGARHLPQEKADQRKVSGESA